MQNAKTLSHQPIHKEEKQTVPQFPFIKMALIIVIGNGIIVIIFLLMIFSYMNTLVFGFD